MAERRTRASLGLVYYLLGDFDGALKLHGESLQIARSLNDSVGMRKAFGNISKCYSAINEFDEAMKYHQQELIIAEEALGNLEPNDIHKMHKSDQNEHEEDNYDDRENLEHGQDENEDDGVDEEKSETCEPSTIDSKFIPIS